MKQHIPSSARGAALIVALILLVIITILGVASMRGTTLQERMSAHMYDRSLAFQGDEAALRALEAQIRVLGNYPPDLSETQYSDGTCQVAPCNTSGYCARPDAECPDRWKNPAFAGWAPVPTTLLAANALGDLAVTPEFFVERMGTANNWPSCDQQIPMHLNCQGERFRATARSTADGRATAMLQVTFAE